ncbi:MAG: efflux RND transporter periplasmic adaptor subunit [Minicystis sp.]
MRTKDERRAGGLLSAGIAALLIGTAGCHKEASAGTAPPAVRVQEESAPAKAASSGAAADKGRIEIDPALVESGRVRVAPAERRVLDGELLLAGDVVPAEDGEADVGALVAGRVAALSAAEGDRVKKGQILALIEAPDVGRATADLLRTRGHAAVAARKLARQIDLEAQHATSQNAVDEARAEDQAARADLAAARTLLATLGAGEPAEGAGAVGARVAVRAPIDGIVVQRSAVLGGPVAIERSLFHLVSPDHLIVRARLPEASARSVPAGTAASIRPRAPAGSARCEATVAASFGIVDEATRTVPLRLRPRGACPFLVPGAYVDVALHGEGAASGERAAAVVVPAEAVVDVRGVLTVFVAADRPGVFLARPVRVGSTAGASLAIEAGLAEGERVVVGGALLLKGEMLRSVLEGG